MRKFMKLPVAVFSVLLLLFSFSARSDQSGDFTYDSYGDSVIITGYTGSGGEVILPDKIAGLPVTAVGNDAFFSSIGLASLTIGAFVNNINDFAFYGCTGLTNIIFSSSVVTIAEYAFAGCISLPACTIPDSVNTIGDYAFAGCTSLSDLIIGNNVEQIGEGAFEYCGNLNSVDIPDNVFSIGGSAFNNCSSLKNITIGKGVVNTGAFAFDGCTSLTSIFVAEANTVYSSDDGVLFNKVGSLLIKCPGGKAGAYTIPDSVNTIGENAFAKCNHMTSVTIGTNVTLISAEAFFHCSSLIRLTIPSSVLNIRAYAFAECPDLTSVFFEGDAPLAGNFLFQDSNKAIVYYLPGRSGWSATYAGRPAKPWLELIVSFDAVGGTVAPTNKMVVSGKPYGELPTPYRSGYNFAGWWTGIGGAAIQITSNKNVTATSNHTLFAKWEQIVTPVIVNFNSTGGTVSPSNKTVVVGQTYGALPEPVRSGYEFKGWWTDPGSSGTRVQSNTVVIAATDHTLYARWENLVVTVTFDTNGGSVSNASKTVTFGKPYGVLPTPARTGYTFNGWWLVLDDEEIQINEFANVGVPTNHTLHAKWSAKEIVVFFDANGGSVAPSSKTVAYGASYGTLPVPVLERYKFVGWWPFAGGSGDEVTEDTIVTTLSDHVVYAKWEKLSDYIYTSNGARITITGYDGSGGDIIIPEIIDELPVTIIDAMAFYGNTNITSIFIPASVTAIGDEAFYGCANLTDINVDAENAFYCSIDGVLFSKDGTELIQYPAGRAGAYTVPDSVIVIGDKAFAWCNGLTDIVISNNVTTIGEEAFAACALLGSVIAGNGVTMIGDAAFADCEQLIEMLFTGDAPQDGTDIFDGSDNVIIYYLPGALGWSDFYAGRPTVMLAPGILTVTFDADGGSVTPTNKTVTFGEAYSTLPTPIRAGYNFAGWWSEAGGGGTQITEETVVTATADHILYAKWTAVNVTVTFDAAGGTVTPANKSVTLDAPYGELPTPTRTGYYFGGWWSEAGGSGTRITTATVVTATVDHTLYAKWTAVNVTVTFDAVGGTVTPANKGVTLDAPYGELPTPTRTGYSFGGWWSEVDGAGTQITSATIVTAITNHTLYAKWTAVNVTVTFDAVGGSVTPANKSVTFGAPYGELPTPIRAGYTFGGWWSEADGTGTQITTAAVVTAITNHTLYAKWTAVNVTVTFDAVGGTVTPANKSVTFGAPYGELPTPIRAGYDFAGWWSEVDGGGTQIMAATVVTATADHTLYAKWEELPTVTVTVTFSASGGKVTPANKAVAVGKPYGALPIPTRAGYNFAGWWTSTASSGVQVTEATVVTLVAQHTLYAKWAQIVPIKVMVSFDAAGGTVTTATRSLTTGKIYGSLPIPNRTGYTFNGWYSEAGGNGTQIVAATIVTIETDHTLYASWSPVTVTLTFNARGGTVDTATKSVTFDAPYGALPVSTRLGFTFEGWWSEAGGTGTEITNATLVATAANHTIHAKWVAIPPVTVKATLNATGGTVTPAEKDVIVNKTYGVLPIPVRPGFNFAGWYLDPANPATVVLPNTVVITDSDHTLHARWLEISEKEPWNGSTYFCDPLDGDPLQTTGSYDGFFFTETEIGNANANAVKGMLTLKLSTLAGKLTAKAVLQTGSLSFSGKVWDTELPDGTMQVTLTVRTGEILELKVRQERIWGTLTGGKLGNEILLLDGGRNRFADKKDTEAAALLTQFTGYYTLSLPSIVEEAADEEINATPQGVGYLAITVGKGGSAKVAGILGDGTKVSQSSRLILYAGCGNVAVVPLFAPLYSKKGWIGGLVWLVPQDIITMDYDNGWLIAWDKPGSGGDGFKMGLAVSGGFYGTLPELAEGYKLFSDAANVPFYYADGVVETPNMSLETTAVDVNGIKMSIPKGKAPKKVTAGKEVIGYEYDEINPSLATLTFTATTGIFKGGYNLYYEYDLKGKLQQKAVKATVGGILTMTRDPLFGYLPPGMGHAIIPDNNPAIKALKLKRSYLVFLDERPLD